MRSAAWSAALGTGALLALAARAYGRRRRAARDAAGPPPRHVAIIMDGNRRFGARAFGPERRLEGHAAGARKLGEVVDWCLGRGVAELTVFAFSTENWDRDADEVAALMREFVARAAEVERRCVERGIRCRILCTAPERLPRAARAALDRLEAATAPVPAPRLVLNIAVSYGARGEIARAARTLAARCARGELAAGEIDEAAVERELLLRSPPDLVVRTSGERRLSNFLLWQAAYAELVFVEKHWPAFAERDLDAALDEYRRRGRRFGR